MEAKAILGDRGLSAQLEVETHSELGIGRGIPSRQTAHVL